MRKLVYVGKDKFDTIVETTSYNEMVAWKEKGFVFKERLDDVKTEETEKQKEKRLARIERANRCREQKKQGKA